MATDNGASITHASTVSAPCGERPTEPTAKNWRHRPRNLKPHDTVTEGDAVGVLLANRPDRVWVDQIDYQRIVGEFGTKQWGWEDQGQRVYVRGHIKTNLSVPRLVLQADGQGFVQYRDGDRLNLRRANLWIGLHKMSAGDKFFVGEPPSSEGLRRVKRTHYRSSGPPTVRQVAPPPARPVSAPLVAPQAARTVTRKPVVVTPAVRRSTR